MGERTIRLVKSHPDCSGWSINQDMIEVDIPKPRWEHLEEFAEKHRMSLDHILAEGIFGLFKEDP